MRTHRIGECFAHRSRCRSLDHVGGDDESRVIIDPRHDRRLPTVHQPHPANDVHLPQLHRPRPFPPSIVALLPAARFGDDQLVTDQASIDRRQRRQRINLLGFNTEPDRPLTPTRLHPSQLDNPRLDLDRHLMRTRQRLRRPIRQTSQTIGRVTAQPSMHRLARHDTTKRHVSDRRKVVDHLQHSCITLLHKPQLHQHDDDPLHD